MADEEKKARQQDLPKPAVDGDIPIDGACMGVLKWCDEQLKNLQPTPKIGARVGWVSRVQRTNPRPGMPAELEYRPADVFRRLGPGQVDLLVIDVAPFPANRATYVRHPEDLKQIGNQIGPGGAWFYLEVLDDPKFQPSAKAFEPHRLSVEERRRKALEDNRKRFSELQQRKALAAHYDAQQAAAAVNIVT